MQTATARVKRLDFDRWVELAKTDPEGFEKKRLETIDQAIRRTSQSQQERLRRLQWRVDRIRERAKTPMAACIAISDMMWDSLNQLNSHFESLREVSAGKPAPQQHSAAVLPFRCRVH